ncbi:MAG: pentapeptide repeat-containing protein [Pseudomonadota bacterium]
METLFQLSRVYFGIRAVVARVVESPFVRLASLILLVVIAWRLIAAPPGAPASADTATVTQAPGVAGSEVADAASAATDAPKTRSSAEAPAPEALPQKGPFDTDLVAWWVASAAAPGASGKVDALEHLHRSGKTFVGLDLSCRRMNGLPTIDVNCANGAFLKGVDLSPVDGRPVDLTSSDLSGANLEEARLRGALLRDAVLARASLANSDLIEADLSAADLRGAILSGATIEKAQMSEAILDSTKLEGAKMQNADLARARMIGADLLKADLTGADLRGADLTGARLTDARLGAARFDVATLSGTEVSGADFGEAQDLDTVFADNVWAWADKPPKNLPATLPEGFQVILCAPGDDEANRRNYENAVKTGSIVRGRPPNC